ncbi:unnamed protein product [Rangifer tarandus platyrhynchus]|uniref:Uncharacterized protein n=1 Tax=Rangifer tarandus platyrhynchus TaxID=3082113 RepID=A0AC59YWB9_RANTA
MTPGPPAAAGKADQRQRTELLGLKSAGHTLHAVGCTGTDPARAIIAPGLLELSGPEPPTPAPTPALAHTPALAQGDALRHTTGPQDV